MNDKLERSIQNAFARQNAIIICCTSAIASLFCTDDGKSVCSVVFLISLLAWLIHLARRDV